MRNKRSLPFRALILCLVLGLLLLAGPIHCYAQDVPPEEPTLFPPSAPYQVTVSGIEEIRATVSWSPVATATQYTVWVDGQRWAGSSCPGAELKGLQPYTEYNIYVTAANDAGESSVSPSVQFLTLPPVPGSPTKPEVIEVWDAGAIIQWQPLPADQYITKYRIYVDGQAVADVDPQEGLQAAELSGLTEGEHQVTVTGINENQEGAPSPPAGFVVASVPAPTGLVLANRSHDKIFVTWDSVPGAEYRVFVDGAPAGETHDNSYVLTGLQPELSCQVSVAAVLADGNQSDQAHLDVSTTPEPDPDIVTLAGITTSTYDHIPEVMPCIIVIFAIGGALKLARAGKYAIGHRLAWYRRS